LCVKGNSYQRETYSPDRIKYPMLPEGRGLDKWKRISWDEALETIAKKIIEIKEKDGSLLGLGLSKYSGNFGITNYGVEGMMSPLGYTTHFLGTPCWPAGIDAQNYDLGDMWCTLSGRSGQKQIHHYVGSQSRMVLSLHHEICL
jgi:anaerobic selenocysteine-containing dehydrogenase